MDTAALLHAHGLVYRDWRAANLAQLADEHFIVLDLESVAAASLSPVTVRLNGWAGSTLDQNDCYTVMSDVHEIGRLLGHLLSRTGLECTSSRSFIAALVDKKLSAVDALHHPWLLSE